MERIGSKEKDTRKMKRERGRQTNRQRNYTQQIELHKTKNR